MIYSDFLNQIKGPSRSAFFTEIKSNDVLKDLFEQALSDRAFIAENQPVAIEAILSILPEDEGLQKVEEIAKRHFAFAEKTSWSHLIETLEKEQLLLLPHLLQTLKTAPQKQEVVKFIAVLKKVEATPFQSLYNKLPFPIRSAFLDQILSQRTLDPILLILCSEDARLYKKLLSAKQDHVGLFTKIAASRDTANCEKILQIFERERSLHPLMSEVNNRRVLLNLFVEAITQDQVDRVKRFLNLFSSAFAEKEFLSKLLLEKSALLQKNLNCLKDLLAAFEKHGLRLEIQESEEEFEPDVTNPLLIALYERDYDSIVDQLARCKEEELERLLTIENAGKEILNFLIENQLPKELEKFLNQIQRPALLETLLYPTPDYDFLEQCVETGNSETFTLLAHASKKLTRSLFSFEKSVAKALLMAVYHRNDGLIAMLHEQVPADRSAIYNLTGKLCLLAGITKALLQFFKEQDTAAYLEQPKTKNTIEAVKKFIRNSEEFKAFLDTHAKEVHLVELLELMNYLFAKVDMDAVLSYCGKAEIEAFNQRQALY